MQSDELWSLEPFKIRQRLYSRQYSRRVLHGLEQRFIRLVFTRDGFVFVRHHRAKVVVKGPNSVLRAEMAQVPGIFWYVPKTFRSSLFAHKKYLVRW